MTKHSDLLPFRNLQNSKALRLCWQLRLNSCLEWHSKKLIVASTRQHDPQKFDRSVRQYKRLVRAYEDMGMVMSTWYSLPRFLDTESRPLPLTAVRGPQSVASLVRLSKVKTPAALAVELMRQSQAYESTHVEILLRLIEYSSCRTLRFLELLS